VNVRARGSPGLCEPGPSAGRARRSLACAAAAGAGLLGGCGGVRAADLFIVQRSGSVPGANLTLLVDEEGGVHCNGGPTLKLSDSQLIEASAIQEDLR
jgi:hypothetical protein